MNKPSTKVITLLVLIGFFVQSILGSTLSLAAEAPGEPYIAPALEATPSVTAIPESGTLQIDPTESETSGLTYTQLMRERGTLNRISNNKLFQFSPAKYLYEQEKQSLNGRLEKFITKEEEKLNKLGVSAKTKEKYLNRLRGQVEDQQQAVPGEEIKIPETPSQFRHETENVPVRGINIKKIQYPTAAGKTKKISFNPLFKVAHAAIPYTGLPVLADVFSNTQSGDSEISITAEIQSLAGTLENNPVKIANFVRNNIRYEPYFGAKKGAIGCLHEKICNDTDTSSLTIALLRSAGIPARYKKSLIVMPVEQLQKLLGVDETKTVFAALAWNKVPVYLVSGGTVSGETLATYDFTNETELALEWTFVEAFYEYNEKGGNISNEINFLESTTDEQVKTKLQAYPEKQWIPIDAVVKPYTHTKKEIAHSASGFNVTNLWTGFLQYQGTQSPIEKFAQDLKTASGKDINTPEYQSAITAENKNYDILPSVPPYRLAIGTNGSGSIVPETWSVLPDIRKTKVTISLKNESNSSTILTHTYNGSEINNVPLNIQYEGATDTDKAVIESYGGIHATPADLVEIKPVFSMEYAKIGGAPADPALQIGDSLILQFDLIVNGENTGTSQKFSIAGNNEGVYLVLSRVQENALLDDETDPDFNSKVLLEGNSELARQYLRRVQKTGDLLGKAMDRSTNTQIMRAVVTQNRVLTKVGDVPTTFDFKGLTIDAETYITGYSNRGDYKSLEKDFHLLWGLQASYDEADIFEDITGLEAISTVKGLQYAYANPAQYTIQTISAANENIIDTLNLSANTKTNMHADIRAGQTIITPDKAVTKGTFTGLLYTSLAADGTGTYAIGEQSQMNGGVTTMYVARETLVASNGNIFESYQQTVVTALYTELYIFTENAYKQNNCSIPKDKFNRIINNIDEYGNPIPIASNDYWLPDYGFPCWLYPANTDSGYYHYGRKDMKIILATAGAKFFMPDHFKYWVTEKKVRDIFAGKNGNIDGVNGVKINKDFKFSSAVGTYLQRGTYSRTSYSWDDPIVVYYQPDSDKKGKAQLVYDKFLNLLDQQSYLINYYFCSATSCSTNEFKVVNRLGYPTTVQMKARQSLRWNTGDYQGFIGGDLYWNDDMNKSFYVPGGIAEEFNSDTYCRRDASNNCLVDENGKKYIGTGGQFGFPIDNPAKILGQENIISQRFEGGEIMLHHDLSTDIDLGSQSITFPIDFANDDEIFWEGVWDSFYEQDVWTISKGLVTGVVLGELVQKAAEMLVKKQGLKAAVKVGISFIPYIGWAISGVFILIEAIQLTPLLDKCIKPYNPPDSPPKYYCGQLAARLVLVGVGTIVDIGANRIFKVFSAQARLGKARLFAKIDEIQFDTWSNIKTAIKGNPQTRTGFFELTNELSDSDLTMLLQKPNLQKRLLEDHDFQIFNKNAINLSRYTHIFEGDSAGGGWHYYQTGKTKPGNARINITKEDLTTGVQEWNVTVNGVAKKSTFFPDNWSEQKVLQAINEAYGKMVKDNYSYNSYSATVEGVKILLFIENDTKKIISSFPYPL
jgi:hypothetical protein